MNLMLQILNSTIAFRVALVPFMRLCLYRISVCTCVQVCVCVWVLRY